MDAIRADYEGPFEQTLRWEEGETSAEAPRTEPTTIHGTVELGSAVHVVSAQPECAERVDIPATVTLHTADGAISAFAAGKLSITMDDPYGKLSANADPSTALGTLDLHLDPTRPHAGSLRGLWQASPAGLHGFVDLEVLYFADQQGAEAYARHPDRVSGIPGYRVHGEFPAD